jgi:hypothetical protein
MNFIYDPTINLQCACLGISIANYAVFIIAHQAPSNSLWQLGGAVVLAYSILLKCSTGASMSHCRPSPASTAGSNACRPIMVSISASSFLS